MIVGLTGGIGSGKSTVLNEFKKLNVPVYIADVEAKKLMNSSEELHHKITGLLGKQAYENKILNRAYVASKVFHNKELLRKLNAIVHPEVHKHFKNFVAQQTASYLVYENAILYENESNKLCDIVIVVAADLEDRIERVLKRDNTTREAILARMNNQWSQEKKIAKADYVVYNNDRNNLKEKVLQLHLKINARILK